MRIFVTLVLVILITACSNQQGQNSKPSQNGLTDQETIENPRARYQVIDEIPLHVQDVENLAVFPGDAEPTHTLKLIPEQTYGKEGEPYLTRVQSYFIDDNDRVILLNSGTNFEQQIYVYNDNGSYFTKVGRKGKGPGEYTVPMMIGTLNDSFLVYDPINKWINVYNTSDYTLQQTRLEERLPIVDQMETEGLNFAYLFPRNDGNLYAVFSERFMDEGRPEVKFHLINPEGEQLDYNMTSFPQGVNVIKPNSMKPSVLRPLHFMGNTFIEISEDNGLYSIFKRDLLIKKYNENGIYQSAIYYKIKGFPLDLDQYTESGAYNRRDIMNTLERYGEELPDTERVVEGMRVDDKNRVWVALAKEKESEYYEWWILEETGELRAKLLLPAYERQFQFKDGFLYSKEISDETGAQYVVKYRIEWSPN